MKRWLNSRTVGWTSAGVVLAAGGLLAVLFAGGSARESANPPAKASGDASPGKDAARSGGQRPQLVRAVRPQSRHLKRETTQAAHVEAYEKVDVYAKASGYLEKFARVRGPGGTEGTERDLDLGDRVEKDQVLAELWVPEMEQERQQKVQLVEKASAEVVQAKAIQDSRAAMVIAAQAKVDQARAALKRYQAEVDFRRAQSERYRRLLRDGTANPEQVDEVLKQHQVALAALDEGQKAVASAQANHGVEQAREAEAQADLKSAGARLKVAQADLKHTEVLLSYAKVRAPFAGVITRRLVDTGTFVQSAALGKPGPLFTLVRVDRLRVVTEVPETDSPWVEVGQPAVLQLNAARGHRFTGRVARLADALDPTSHTMTVEVELDDRDRKLRPGLYGEVTITLADYPNALTLPTSALVPAGGKPTVMIVKDGVARSCPVTLGINDGIQMQITGGLTGDELVITDGKDSVRDGQPVQLAGK